MFGAPKDLAQRIFLPSLEDSRDALLPWIQHANFSLMKCYVVCKNKWPSFQEFLDNPVPLMIPTNPDLLWNPPVWEEHDALWVAMWIRLNCGSIIYPKIDDPFFGLDRYCYTRTALEATGQPERIKRRRRPLEILRDRFPTHQWELNEVPQALRSTNPQCSGTLVGEVTNLSKCSGTQVGEVTNLSKCPVADLAPKHQCSGPDLPQNPQCLGAQTQPVTQAPQAVLRILSQCRQLHSIESDPEIRDALWFYYCCFIDYIYNNYSEHHYPWDNRAFTAFDLPDCFHTLVHFTFWGEQLDPNFLLGKFMLKSLPYAGARRQLVEQTDEVLLQSDAGPLQRLFSSLFYCMLLDQYPEHLSPYGRNRRWDLPYLLRCKHIASDRALLRRALIGSDKDKGCYMIFSAFRMWYLMMGDNQKHLQKALEGCFDWDNFVAQTRATVFDICQSNVFDDADPFRDARIKLSKSNKNPKTKVGRYKRADIINTLADRMVSLRQDDAPERVKASIFNALMRTHPRDWLSDLSLSIMRLSDFGAVSSDSILRVKAMMDLYYLQNTKPKDFEQLIALLGADLAAIAWYFHTLSVLSNVDFDALPYAFVKQIDDAVARKYDLRPGEEVPPFAYTVFVSLCCQKIKTLLGPNVFGHDKISYNAARNIFVCSKPQKKPEEAPTTARAQRKTFNFIPCENNPVLPVDIRGFVLIFNKQDRYLQCPWCAGFHKYHPTGFRGDSYYCPKCLPSEPAPKCHICWAQNNSVRAAVVPELLPTPAFVKRHFCSKHYPK